MIGAVFKNKNADISTEEMAKINNYTRRELTSDEVYTFKVVLCDNDIDRDFECFSVNALNELKELFVGKSNVFDHQPKAENQTARIYDCYLEEVSGQKTKTNEQYMRLVAKAYMPKSEKNKDFILSLDSGIQKEVSVGCSVSESICSICKQNTKGGICSHIKGKTYDSKQCFNILNSVQDAYEWSFVAVPAQRQAGVIKSYTLKTKGENMEEIKKSLQQNGGITLNSVESNKLYSYIQELEEDASFGKAYKEDLKKSVINLAILNKMGIQKDTLISLTDKMNITELKAFNKAFEENKLDYLACKPQLNIEDSNPCKSEYSGYKI